MHNTQAQSQLTPSCQSHSQSRSSVTDQTSSSLTAEELIDLQFPEHVRLSPGGDRVVYSLKPRGRKGERYVSSIWMAECHDENSARQITSGEFNDRSPEWSPDGSQIAFLSDRQEVGKTCVIYLLSITLTGGEAYPVTDASHSAYTSSFSWSPHGRFIAYASPQESSEERKAKNAKKDDVRVYGDDWQYNRLRVLHVATREVVTIFSKDADVRDFAWSPDSLQLAFTTARTTTIDAAFEYGLRFGVAPISGKPETALFDFPGGIVNLVWHDDTLRFLAGVVPNMISTSAAVFSASLESGKYQILAHGHEDSAVGMRPFTGGVTVHVQVDLEDEISVIGHDVLFKVEQSIVSYDVARDSDGHYLLTFITSAVGSPPEVYFKSSTSSDITRLSSHGQSIRPHVSASFKAVRCSSFDGKVELDAFWAAPTALSGPVPTLVHIHGGPADRVTNCFDASIRSWFPYLLSQNRYGILSVNYRGGTGRGHDFASGAAGGLGTMDHADVLALVNAAVAQGLVDSERIVVSGWSQGGFLSYLSAVRNGTKSFPNGSEKTWRFKGAICCAGISDWDMICMSDDVPAFTSEQVGAMPWTTVDKSCTSGRQGSAIWEFAPAAAAGSIPPILIIHGEADQRVPLSQAVAFHRGCLKWGGEMAVYPREPHVFTERAHLVDVLKRVLRFVDFHLSA